MLVTIFTPTYNRGYIIETLYQSLLKQTNQNFEWLIVDDGSTDNTEQLISNFQKQGKINIRYIKTANGGKQRAINNGAAIAQGELFFIVDSDDYLTTDAIECVISCANSVIENEQIGGLCFRRVNYNTMEILGGDHIVDVGDYTPLEIHFKLGITADKAEIFKTTVLRKFPFPDIKGENFVPEAYVWNKIGERYKLRFINRGIYMCEYLEDGLSRNFKVNLKKNPRGFGLYYREVLNYSGVPFLTKIKATIRLIQCQFYSLTR